jgi:hypothetical protein
MTSADTDCGHRHPDRHMIWAYRLALAHIAGNLDVYTETGQRDHIARRMPRLRAELHPRHPRRGTLRPAQAGPQRRCHLA